MSGPRPLEGMILGAASSAFQIEGSWDADGKGESIWDRWCHIPGRCKATGDVACDHYRRFQEDVQLLKQIGVDSYRFSVSWPRVMPQGRGPVNQAGLDFYRRLVDLLRKNGIKAAVTIYHWDLPQTLQDLGGWANPDTAAYFRDYAGTLFEAIGRDVDVWITHNEP